MIRIFRTSQIHSLRGAFLLARHLEDCCGQSASKCHVATTPDCGQDSHDILSKQFTVKILQTRSWRESKRVLNAMERWRFIPTVVHYGAALKVCSRNRQCKAALSLLDEMFLEKNTPPNLICYNTALSACANAGQHRAAVRLLDKMESRCVIPNVVSFNSAMQACIKAAQPKRLWEIHKQMRQKGVEPDLVTYTTIINASGWQQALDILNELQQREDLEPDVVCYSAILRKLLRSRQHETALKLLAGLHDKGVMLDRITYNMVINSCPSLLAMRLLRDMESRGIVPDSRSYTAAIRGSGSSNKQAVSRDTLISANVGEEQDDSALPVDLINEMESRGVYPDVVTYNAALSVYGRQGDTNMVLELLRRMQKSEVQPDQITFTTAIKSCFEGHRFSDAFALLCESQQERFLPNFAARSVNKWDLHGLSLATSCMVLSHGFLSMVFGQNASNCRGRDVWIITGKGEGGQSKTILRYRVPQFLEAAGLEVSNMQGDSGTIMIRRKSIDRWFKTFDHENTKQLQNVFEKDQRCWSVSDFEILGGFLKTTARRIAHPTWLAPNERKLWDKRWFSAKVEMTGRLKSVS